MYRPLLLVPLTLLALASVARAQSSPPDPPADDASDVAVARALFGDARAQIEAGRFAEAEATLVRALALHDAPSIRWNLALTRAQRGRLVEAREALRAVRRQLDPRDPRRADADARIAALGERIAELTLVTPDAPEGVVVRVDGETLHPAALGFPRPVDPGAHRITATAPGHEPVELVLELAEGASRRLELTLRPSATAPTPPPTPALEARVRAAVESTVAPANASPTDDGGDVTDEWWFWTAIGSVGAGLIAGAIAIVVAETSGPAHDLPGGPIETSGGCE